MPVLVDVQIAPQYEALVDQTLLRRAVAATLRHQGLEEGEATLVITDDEGIRTLNFEFRDLDMPTDVLAFPGTLDESFVVPEGYSGYLGDVVISYPRAEEQARAAGHPVARELQLLTIHGVLHLLGLDDADEAGWRQMTEAQEEILAEVAAAPPSKGGTKGEQEGSAIGQ